MENLQQSRWRNSRFLGIGVSEYELRQPSIREERRRGTGACRLPLSGRLPQSLACFWKRSNQHLSIFKKSLPSAFAGRLGALETLEYLVRNPKIWRPRPRLYRCQYCQCNMRLNACHSNSSYIFQLDKIPRGLSSLGFRDAV